MKEKFIKTLVLSFVSLMLVLSPLVTTVKADTTVTNMTELQDAVTNIEDGGVITLAPGFVRDATLITFDHGNSFTVDGGGQEFTVDSNQKHLRFSNTGASTQVTIKNITFDGNGFNGGVDMGGVIEAVYDNVVVKNNFRSALIARNNQKLTILNSSIIDNEGAVDSVVYIEQNAVLLVENSTFINNTIDYAGYSGGAIRIMNSSGQATIRNSYFKDNRADRNGGAISVYQPSGAKVLVDECYFEGNNVFGNNSNADGGAVSVYPTGRNSELVVKNSTFYKNWANDDAGAVFFENDGANSVNVLENNTFVENYSQDSNPTTASSGGAVQLSLKTTVTSNHNTYYGNYGPTGGALGAHFYWRASSDRPVYISNNDLFIGNRNINKDGGETVNNNANIGSYFNPFTNNNSVGVDFGTALPEDYTVYNVFGTDTPGLVSAGCSKLVGNPNDGTQTILKVLTNIVPNNSETGLTARGPAYGVAVAPNALDQRGVTRANPADVGAVDILYIQFDGNGGHWSGEADTMNYDGNLYYKLDEDGLTTERLEVLNFGEKGRVTEEDPTREGYTFLGWHTDPLSTVALTADELDAELENITTHDKVLYAVWQEPIEKVNVKYYYKHSLDVTTDYILLEESEIDAETTINLLSTVPEWEGYRFLGWRGISESGLEDDYAPNALVQVIESMEFYAQWERIPLDYKVEYYHKQMDEDHADGVLIYDLTVKEGTVVTTLDAADVSTTEPGLIENHTLIGWTAVFEDGTEKFIALGAEHEVTGNVKLYTKWETTNEPVVTATIEYYYKHSTNDSDHYTLLSSLVSNIGREITILDTVPEWKGYKFKSWLAVFEDGTQINIAPGSQYTLTENVKLYAQWEAVKTPPTGVNSFGAYYLGLLVLGAFVLAKTSRKIKE